MQIGWKLTEKSAKFIHPGLCEYGYSEKYWGNIMATSSVIFAVTAFVSVPLYLA